MRFSALALTVLCAGLVSSTGHANDTKEWTQEEIDQCVADCVDTFGPAGRTLRLCVDRCLGMRREPIQSLFIEEEPKGSAPQFCETYEPGCDSIP